MYPVKVVVPREAVVVCEVLLALLNGAELAPAPLHQAAVHLQIYVEDMRKRKVGGQLVRLEIMG